MTAKMGNRYNVLSLEAKDIFCAMQTKGQYKLPLDQNKTTGTKYFSKFNNTLDWSLDSEQIEKVYAKTNRKKSMGFKDNKGNLCSLVVINVSFSYTLQEFNSYGNVFVKNGVSVEDCVFDKFNHITDDKGQLIAIRLNVNEKNPLPDDILLPYFQYDKAKGCYARTDKKIKKVLSTQQLRENLYQNGFDCEDRHYVRYKRSSGSSREGKCLFVDESVFKKMNKWSCCGLEFDDKKFDATSWEAYKALSLSSVVEMVDIPVEKILFVDDFKSVFKEKSLAISTDENKSLVADEKVATIQNDIWDGESLLDESVFLSHTKGMDISDKSMLLLRNNFFKTCAFRTKLQQFFADNNADINLVKKYGVTLAKDVKDIVMVTTPSSLKYLKFVGGKLSEKAIKKWAENVDSQFGIVKCNKISPFFNGDMVQSSYQLLNTVQLTQQEAEQVVLPSAKYLESVRKDSDVMAFHLFDLTSKEESLFANLSCNKYESRAQVVMRLLAKNTTFANTRIFRDLKNKITNDFRKNLKRGHILLSGTNATLFGNGVELLFATIGKFDRKNPVSVLQKGQISCKKFADNCTLVGARSPHLTMGNLLVCQNVYNETIDRYFVLANEIVCVNAIGENIQQRLNGCDYDSDTMLLTDDKLIVKKAVANYDRFLVPVCEVEKSPVEKTDLATLDQKISINKIGEIVNLSQRLNSLYWDMLYDGKKDGLDDVYKDICKLAVLSGIEIDKAKRKYDTDVVKELGILYKKYKDMDSCLCKPLFFKTIDEDNQRQTKKGDCYYAYNTAMDFIWQGVDNINFLRGKAKKATLLNLSSFVTKPVGTPSKTDYLHKDKIVLLVQKYDAERKKLRLKKEYADENTSFVIDQKMLVLKQECHEAVNKLCSSKYVVWLVLNEIEKEQNSSISNCLFEMLFEKQNKIANEMFVDQNNDKVHLERDDNGDLLLYGIRYKKCKIKV